MFHTHITISDNLHIHFAEITWLVVHWQRFRFSDEMLHAFDWSGLTILLLHYLFQASGWGKPSLQARIMNGKINTLLKYILSYCLFAEKSLFPMHWVYKTLLFHAIPNKKGTLNRDYIAVFFVYSQGLLARLNTYIFYLVGEETVLAVKHFTHASFPYI